TRNAALEPLSAMQNMERTKMQINISCCSFEFFLLVRKITHSIDIYDSNSAQRPTVQKLPIR
ncbi:hypothetical protein, partial [Vibrio vulnificus]|uniref:hypothetical protein n=1 Tax=Vibrio vulnificus TaxID=672 RepID=UPI0039B416BF